MEAENIQVQTATSYFGFVEPHLRIICLFLFGLYLKDSLSIKEGSCASKQTIERPRHQIELHTETCPTYLISYLA